jgi:hypothetical protein
VKGGKRFAAVFSKLILRSRLSAWLIWQTESVLAHDEVAKLVRRLEFSQWFGAVATE